MAPGKGAGTSPGEVHDIALKAAETDATKRALATFGRPFGLELHNGARREQQDCQRRPGASSSAQKDGLARSAPAPIARRAEPHPSRDGSTDRPNPVASAPSLVPDVANTNKTGANTYATQADSHDPPSAVHGAVSRPSPYLGRERFQQDRAANDALVKQAEQQALAAEAARQAGSSHTALKTYDQPGTLQPLAPTTMPHAPPLAVSKIDKSVLTFGEPKRLRDKAHLRFVASQPCLICGRNPSDAHHLRFAQPRALGRKVSDEFAVPLCRTHHREVHQTGNEAALWEDLEINALEIAKALWDQNRM